MWRLNCNQSSRESAKREMHHVAELLQEFELAEHSFDVSHDLEADKPDKL